jgi:hypothetical protein
VILGFSFACSLVHVLHNYFFLLTDWQGIGEHDRVHRQLSVSSDSKLLDDDIREETRVIMRPKKPPRPKSEVFLNKQDQHPRRKRFSAFGVSLNLLFLFKSINKTTERDKIVQIRGQCNECTANIK